MLNPLKFSYYPFLLLFASACASIGTPEGGPRDEKAPNLVQSNPANGALNVNTRRLTLTFDEEIQVKDFNRQVLFTPNLNNPTEATVKKQTLTIDFEKDLQPNTTYFINFRDAVTDLTEGNKPENLTLTFSTGAYIDSGRVSGTVKDLYTDLPEKNINVVLYNANDTMTIRKHRPYYFTQTDDKGNFVFRNIRNGSYRILTHQDKNNNMIYDNEGEKIGYRSEPITITHSTPLVDLVTLKIDTRKPLVERTDRYQDEFRISYNEGLTAIKVTPLTAAANQSPFHTLIQNKGNQASLFPLNPITTATKFIVSATDSSANTRTDTLNIAFDNKRAPRNAEPISVKTYSGQLTKTDPVEINFNVPIKVLQPQAITVIEDSTARRTLSYPQDFKLDPTATKLTLTQLLKANNTAQILIDTTKLVPVAGQPFKKPTLRFPVTNKIQVGTLIAKVDTKYNRYWVEILNDGEEVVYTLESPKQIRLDRIEPGKYRIRVKIDEDNDGTWRKGNPDLKTPPEKIYHYPEKLDIRANWEIEIAPPMPPLSF